eukprot:TRINITY_DN7076_c0_g7_i1.p1 TRINITY_DN7076_c0_g7~~TRINITY_DN7076_c0_g7_i1.p1  ORF type:complete len:371 (+),score=53.90 TRINITY_DN7076_c0_g7_i1:34-1146(+)
MSAPTTWRHFPVQCKLGSRCKCPCACLSTLIPVNNTTSTPFSTDLFEGEVSCCIKGIPGNDDPWKGRYKDDKRAMSITVRGRFKEKICCSDVVCGMEWEKELSNLPWSFVLSGAEKVISLLSQGTKACLAGENPHFLNNLMVGVDTFSVEQGSPPIATHLVVESSPYGETPSQRMNHAAANADSMYFSPDVTYTFDFWADKLDFRSFSAIVPGLPPIALHKYFNGQPYPFIAKTTDGRVLWHIEVWHEMLFPNGSLPSEAGLRYEHGVEKEAEKVDEPIGQEDVPPPPPEDDDDPLIQRAAEFYIPAKLCPQPHPLRAPLSVVAILVTLCVVLFYCYPLLRCDKRLEGLPGTLQGGVCFGVAVGIGWLFF